VKKTDRKFGGSTNLRRKGRKLYSSGGLRGTSKKGGKKEESGEMRKRPDKYAGGSSSINVNLNIY